MKREVAILLAFIKDKLSLMALFITNTALIILFFNLFLKSNEWMYPVLISSVIFIPYLIAQWFSYRKLMLMLDISEVIIPDEIYTNTQYIKKVNSTLIRIHKNYNYKLNKEMQNNIEFRRFISQFIHAMKTPVTVIELAIQRCKDNLYNEAKEDAEYTLKDTINNTINNTIKNTIEDISEENTRQLEMLNNLLEYLRLEEFSKDYTPVPVDLLSELTQVINSKKRSFIYNNVRPNILTDKQPIRKNRVNEVDNEVDNEVNNEVNDTSEVTTTEEASSKKDLVEIFTDVKWNRIMLDQIISNAIKYSAATDKMKTVDFSITHVGDKTILTISDGGMGIPKQDIAKVMDAFFTGDNGRRMKNATGIGLYIVKLISENLGHEIHIESQVGVGTKVKITYRNIQNYRLI